MKIVLMLLAIAAALPLRAEPLGINSERPGNSPLESARQTSAERIAKVGDKLRCDQLKERKSSGKEIYFEDDESVPPWMRELFLPEWCRAELKAMK